MPNNPQKKEKGTNLTRRKFVGAGVAAGGLTLITSRKSIAQFGGGPSVPQEPPLCDEETLETSPATRPFRQALPIPPVAQPVALNPAPTQNANIARGEAARAPHQRWNEFLPVANQMYRMEARPALWRFHPDLPSSYIWGFNGITPGPTVLGRYGQPAIVRFVNKLPEDFESFGIPEMTVHLHNGHTASESDGFAGDFFGPGLFKDNHYPNVYAGVDAFGPFPWVANRAYTLGTRVAFNGQSYSCRQSHTSQVGWEPPNVPALWLAQPAALRGDWREAQYTYWYHDHRAMFTAQNNYRGLQGFYWLFDDRDSGNERDPNPQALHLPSGYGQFDIPLIFKDVLMCPDATLFALPDGVFQGDKWCVNGAINPFLRVQRRKYRFRLLNPGIDRTWVHRLVSDRRGQLPITVIATDGNLLRNPVQVDEIIHSVAERYDIIVDFSEAQIGERIYLLNINEEDDPQFVGFPSPTPLPNGVEVEQVVMRFDVTSNPTSQDLSQVPKTLTEYPSRPAPVRTKVWEFTRNDTDPEASVFEINGKTFDAARSDHQVRRGTAETWILRNLVPESEWTHPVHIHFEEFRVLSRNGEAPPAIESGRKDVIRLGPGEEIRLYMQFRDFQGRYLIHCHNMNHEDIFMMVRWDIVP